MNLNQWPRCGTRSKKKLRVPTKGSQGARADMSGVQCCQRRFALRHIYNLGQLSINMRLMHNALLYSMLAVIFLIYGVVQQSELSIGAAMILAAVGSYWVWKVSGRAIIRRCARAGHRPRCSA